MKAEITTARNSAIESVFIIIKLKRCNESRTNSEEEEEQHEMRAETRGLPQPPRSAFPGHSLALVVVVHAGAAIETLALNKLAFLVLQPGVVWAQAV